MQRGAPSPADALATSFAGAAGHHAHLIVGPDEEAYRAVLALATTTFGLSCEGNPDVVTYVYPSVGVDEARAISTAARVLPLGNRRLIILRCGGLTREAQNALLKTIEEPVAGVIFFIIVPTLDTILPTIRSRVAMHRLGADGRAEHEDGEAFLSASVPKRLGIVRALAAAISDEERPRSDALSLLAAIEAAAYRSHRGVGPLPPALAAALADIAAAKRYASDRSASLKMLLEQLALTLPSTS